MARVERALLLRKLQRLGIRILDWPVDRPFEPLVRATLSRVGAGWTGRCARRRYENDPTHILGSYAYGGGGTGDWLRLEGR